MITTANVLDSLCVTPKVIVELVRSADAGRVKVRPRPGAWSIHEHACHLAVVQPIMMQRMEYILSTGAPHIKGYQPGRDDDPDELLKMDLDECLARYQADRAEIIRRLETLSEADWHKPAVHEEYTAYSIAIMFRHMALHDYLHAYRIESLIIER